MNLNDILLRSDLPDVRERFESRVMADPSGCHMWVGRCQPTGHPYGRITLWKSQFYAHRVAWVLYRGPILKGAQVLHRCDVPECVNPGHLFLGDRTVNMADMAAKDRSVSGQRNWTNKLTPEQVQAIRLASGTQRDIANAYGVDKTTVGNIKRGERWCHLPWPS